MWSVGECREGKLRSFENGLCGALGVFVRDFGAKGVQLDGL